MQQFSRKTLEFLVENRLNDSRDWYMEHKGEYEQFVYEPLRCLVTALTPRYAENRSGVCGCSVCRTHHQPHSPRYALFP